MQRGQGIDMFITLEGIEGSGKTTQIENIVAYIRSRDLECVTTREPGGSPIGAQIRKILLDPANGDLDPGAELMLYLADRIQHLRRVIYPQLSAGKVVLCDRFFDATLVYQGYARGYDLEIIRTLHGLVCDDIQPDLTLLLDLTPQQGLDRAWSRIHQDTEQDTRFEQEKLDFHQKVRQGYLDLARQAPERFRIIDASQTQGKVARDIEAALAPCISAMEKK